MRSGRRSQPCRRPGRARRTGRNGARADLPLVAPVTDDLGVNPSL